MVAVGVAVVVTAQVVAPASNLPGVRSGAALMLLQASGPVFVALVTIVVLGACGQMRGRPAARFWIACVAASTLTYVAWSTIYFVADGGSPAPPPLAARQFVHDLPTASARPQLALSWWPSRSAQRCRSCGG